MATLGFVMREGKCAPEVSTSRQDELSIEHTDSVFALFAHCGTSSYLSQVQTNPSDV